MSLTDDLIAYIEQERDTPVPDWQTAVREAVTIILTDGWDQALEEHEALTVGMPEGARCGECEEMFDAEEWPDRHTDPLDGSDVHEGCCKVCNPPDA